MNFEFINKEITQRLVFIKDAVLFPDVTAEVSFNNSLCLKALEGLQQGDEIIITTLKNSLILNPAAKDLFSVGVLGHIDKISNLNQQVKATIEIDKRVQISKFKQVTPFFIAEARELKDDIDISGETESLKQDILENIKKLSDSGICLPLELIIKLLSTDEPNSLINSLTSVLDGAVIDKQNILETVDLKKRLLKTLNFIKKVLSLKQSEDFLETDKQNMPSNNTHKFDLPKNNFYESNSSNEHRELSEYDLLRQDIDSAGMPKEVKEIALKELKSLEKSPAFSPEVSFARNYLDWLIFMPWKLTKKRNINISKARKILNDDHFGLEKVKQRILEYLAVKKLTGKLNGPILCFIGPPGTGKTSISKSIAKALNTEFIRISLGGVRDEAEIKGHRRTYVGAIPGRIIQGIKKSKINNPVFMLDEIDKLGSDYRGDPSSALLEALDPEQNSNFSDHYLEVPFDLSYVTFIATANDIEEIPLPLRDRMELINFSGYSEIEKFNIAKIFIWPKVCSQNGISSKSIILNDQTIRKIISHYTAESGVRELKRQLDKVARKIALKISDKQKINREILPVHLYEFLGQPKSELWKMEKSSHNGLVAALAVTNFGGEVLSVEASTIPSGKGDLILTGQLGNVMKESAQAALSYVRTISTKLAIDPAVFKNEDIHIHIPMGGVPKDGPSAGVALTLAIISALNKKNVNKDVGVTGEITLRGKILKIGGLSEKILAAKRVGLSKVIIPLDNRQDLDEMPKEYKEDIKIYFASDIFEVLPIALDSNTKH